MNLISELKRRNVIRMAGLYLVGAWLVAQVAGTILPAFEVPNWVMRGIVIVLALGFVPALAVAWIFELTPQGLKRDEDVAPGQSIAPQTARRMDRMLLVVSMVALGYFAFDKFLLDPRRDATLVAQTTETIDAAAAAKQSTVIANSIAVLPFADLSPDKDQAYFSDGMSEEILNVLTRVKGLQVASRTSSFAFKDQQGLGIPAIAEKLSVRHVLEGSVRRSGNTLRITAQLIDAKVDRHLWSETFDRPLTAENVFAIQDEIAAAILRALVESIKLDAQAPPRRGELTSDLSAYDAYLKARALFQSRRRFDVADQLLEGALQKDPDFVAALELRAALYSLMSSYVVDSADPAELERKSIAFAEQALAIDPDSALALASIANIRSQSARELKGKYDIAVILADLQRAHELEPSNGNMLNWLGMSQGHVGELQAALRSFQSCIKVDPRLAPCVENEYETLFVLGREQEAFDHYLKAMAAGLVTNEYTNFSLLARFEQKTAFLLALNLSGWLPGNGQQDAIYQAYRNLGADHHALLQQLAPQLELRSRQASYLGNLLTPLGNYDWLPIPMLIWGADFALYRRSPEFKRYIRESGALAYWQGHGFPPQCRAIGASDFECP